MPRLIDEIRANWAFAMPQFVTPRFYGKWEKHTRQLAPILADEMPVLLLDNVADYYYRGTGQEYWDLRKDFPNLAPPYPQFWAEHKMANIIHSDDCGDTDVAAIAGSNHTRVGVLVTALDPAIQTYGPGGTPPPGTKWVMWIEMFISYGWRKHEPPDGPNGSIFYALDAEGRLLGKPYMQTFAERCDEELMQSLMGWAYPTLLAISFMHCKNVRIDDHSIDKPLAKKFHAKTGQWPTRYKTLVIEPLKQILRHEGKSDEDGLAKAMHICRGHFRDYREGRGLFGKYHQLVWSPMTVRGTKGKDAPPREVKIKVPA